MHTDVLHDLRMNQSSCDITFFKNPPYELKRHGKNYAHILNLFICICQGCHVCRSHFTAGFTVTFMIKDGGKKVVITIVSGKLPSCHGNPNIQ